jgi:hypothetical protein
MAHLRNAAIFNYVQLCYTADDLRLNLCISEIFQLNFKVRSPSETTFARLVTKLSVPYPNAARKPITVFTDFPQAYPSERTHSISRSICKLPSNLHTGLFLHVSSAFHVHFS